MKAATVAIAIYRVSRSRSTSTQKTNSSPDLNLRAYPKYATEHRSYRIWPDYLFEVFKGSVAITLIVTGTTVYLIGLVIAWPYEFMMHYVLTPAIYIGLAGILLVIGACHWGSRRVHPDYEQLRPVFTVDDDTYYRILNKWFRRFSSRKPMIVCSLIFFVVGFGGLTLAYGTSARTRKRFYLEPLRPILFGRFWYIHKFEDVGFSIILVYLILISITLGTGCWLLVANMVFLSKLRRLPVIPMPTIVRARLRRMADLYVGTSFAWSLGVALFGVLFYKDYNLLSGVFLAALFVIGVLMFSLPQAICRSYIIRSHERLCTMGLAELYKDLGMSLYERTQTTPAISGRVADNLADLYSMTDRPKTLVYDVQNVVLWVGSEVLAFVAILPHGVLTDLLHVLRV